MESEKDVVAAWCRCNKIVLAMTTDEYQRSGKPEIDSFFDMGYKIGRTTKAVARNLFGCECESKKPETSDEALHIGSVVKPLPTEFADWIADQDLYRYHDDWELNMEKFNTDELYAEFLKCYPTWSANG